jgi:hypothetical protein
VRKTGKLSRRPLARTDAADMLKRRLKQAGLPAHYSPHPFRATMGDLLTTSSTPGHAMKAADALKAFGSIIGKALRPFKQGQGLIPILVALQ